MFNCVVYDITIMSNDLNEFTKECGNLN